METVTLKNGGSAVVGCWLDGCLGWHNHGRLIRMAVRYGMKMTSDDAEMLAEYEADQSSDAANVVINQGGLLDEAENWLNANIAPEGYSFGWHNGDFMLASVEWWDEKL